MKRPFRITLALAILLLVGASLPGSAAPAALTPPPDPVFWNRLGSEQEVLNSEIGPDILLTSYKYTDWQEARFEPAKFDNGLFVNHDTYEGANNDGANFFAIDTTQMAPTSERGTIEFWFKFRYGADTWNHAYFFDTRNAFMDHYPDQNWVTGLNFAAGWNGWNYGSFGKRFFFSIGSATQGAVVYTPDFSANPGGSLDFTDGTLMHFAFVWDENGIGGSADTLRIYVDGNLMGTSNQQWPANLSIDQYLFIGSGPNCCGWDHHYNAVKGVTDNLIIWDFAKTDFWDRDRETPVQPPVSEAGGPYTVPEGGTIMLSASGSSGPHPSDILTYAWDLDADGSYGETGSDATRGDEIGVAPIFSAAGLDGPGLFTVRLQVTDPHGLSNTDTATINIVNVPPVVNAGPDQVTYQDTAVRLAPATLTDAGTPDTHVATINWGDGTVQPGAVVESGGSGTVAGSHSYLSPGTYSVTVTVTDDDGGMAADTLVVKAAHGFLRFCGFAENAPDSVQVQESARIACSLGSNGRLDIQKSATITGDMETGGGRVDLGEAATVQGDVRAVGDVVLSRSATVDRGITSGHDVTLKQSARVRGDVAAAGRVRLEAGAAISGTISQGVPVPPIPSVTPVHLALRAGGPDVTVKKNDTRTLPPGSYGRLMVGDGATLLLSAGSYAFERVNVEKNAAVTATLAGGNLLVDVVRDLDLKENLRMAVTGGSASNVLFRVQGGRVALGKSGSYLGTYLAPDANVELGEDAALQGALYGQKLTIRKSATITGEPALDLYISLYLP